MRYRALASSSGWCPACLSGACAKAASPSRRATTIDRTETMYARRLRLTAMLFPVFTLSAQQQGVAAPSAATIAAVARSAPLDRAHARSASIDGKRFDITPADLSAVTSLDRLR